MPLTPLNGTASITSPDSRSEEVQEILGHIPGWTLRWGITGVSIILGLILLGSWLIRYPDIITAQIVLTTHTPPAPIIARAGGRLHMNRQDKQLVEKGAVLGYLENPAQQEDVLLLKQQLAMYQEKPDHSDIFSTEMQVGELQPVYLRFISTLRNDQLIRQQKAYSQRIAALQARIAQYRQLNESLEKQSHLLVRELELARKQYDRDQGLYEQQTIAAADWEQRQTAFLKVQQNYESVQASGVTNDIQVSQLQAQLLDLLLAQEQEQAEAQSAITDALQQLESELASWEQRYLLKAPIAGHLTFTNYWSDVHFVQAGEEIMTVVPRSDALYGQVRMPIAGSGKVEVGQTVHIKFDNYPFAEYGTVLGEVATISEVPYQQLYTIEVHLPHGLTTSYHKELPFRQEMSGSANIITRDMRLIERIFYQLRQLIDQAS
ncbi:MAG: HlyD family efflux transporter periplasmic adaptor subunit [Cyclobacteriaceae bacterium]